MCASFAFGTRCSPAHNEAWVIGSHENVARVSFVGTPHVTAWFFRFLQDGGKRKNYKTRDLRPGNMCMGGHWISIIIDIIPSRVLSGLWKLRAVIDKS